jgi:hypothetical protein
LLELIQNADDNRYNPGANPNLFLKVTPQYIWISNNEAGFRPEDVRALCDVGGSTKKGLEFIGHKGIGFKSVFKVSDTPHVISGEYRFKFDVHHALGCIFRSLDNSITTKILSLSG